MPELEQETGLPKLKPLTRKQVAEMISKVSGVADHFGNMPHKDALAATAQLEDLESMLAEILPGHERIDNCEGCGAALGADDPYGWDTEGVRTCPACGEAQSKPNLSLVTNQEKNNVS
ncbi:hypothetical protein MXMO3_01783 [Maritalea myrionectae]|uniref:Uncharacterized protein n=1 Tax=Maritalea myrionectae TaxID=454601 RepID=A0A2R4ME42_9HYPH|nr:hypothetical protein [Maritalea myrionectae]AVX04308.1 hypothetical protein MXMO3_01783 [Maritalea myrionectae]